ncbi:DEAD-box ATP-dependent RNA helicase 38 [Tanacetum coccineum]
MRDRALTASGMSTKAHRLSLICLFSSNMRDRVHTATEIKDENWALVLVPKATPEVKPYASDIRIEELNPTLRLLKGLCMEMKYETLSKIQEEMLPLIVTPPHKNIVAQSPIGTGMLVAVVTAILYFVDPENKN